MILMPSTFLLKNLSLWKRAGSTLAVKYFLFVFLTNFSSRYDGWEWHTKPHSLAATLIRILFLHKVIEIILIMVCCSLYL